MTQCFAEGEAEAKAADEHSRSASFVEAGAGESRKCLFRMVLPRRHQLDAPHADQDRAVMLVERERSAVGRDGTVEEMRGLHRAGNVGLGRGAGGNE
jgi:hypothetical protein